MKLKNVLIVVKDIEASKAFYRSLFGLEALLDLGDNVILSEGLVLQEEGVWRAFIEKEVVPQSNSCLLYFEEADIEGFVRRLETLYPDIRYLNPLMTLDWGKKFVRFYDPDGNLIEVGTPV